MSDLKPQEIRGIAAQSGCRIMIENGTGHELYCFNSLTEFADNLLSHAARCTQPEATAPAQVVEHQDLGAMGSRTVTRYPLAPAQDLSAAILALESTHPSDKFGTYDMGFYACRKAAAALASSANALSAGDIENTPVFDLLKRAIGVIALHDDDEAKAIAADARAILQSQKGGSHG